MSDVHRELAHLSDEALVLLERCGIGASARPEELGLPEFACLAAGIPVR